MEISDGDLISRYRRGDVDALDALVQRYRRPLYGFILNMIGGSGRDADEIFQEVWLRAIRSLTRYRQQNFGGWLMRIARNFVIDQSRRRKPVVSLDQEPSEGSSLHELIPGEEPDPAEKLADGDIGDAIAAAVATLPDEQREVFLMRVKGGVPFKEIAAIQGVSINTALGRMQYALARLRPLLTEQYEALGR